MMSLLLRVHLLRIEDEVDLSRELPSWNVMRSPRWVVLKEVMEEVECDL